MFYYIVFKSQEAHVNERFISEDGRLIDDFLKLCDMLNKKYFFVTIDLEQKNRL